jgi:histidine kinase
MDAIRSRLGLKIFLSYLLVILIGMAVLALTTRFTVPGAFNRHMAGMGRQFGPMGMMRDPSLGMMGDFYRSFRDSFNEAMLTALLVATVAAVGVSLLLSQGIVAPVRAMMQATQRIAEGHYEERVQIRGSDELQQLAARFNTMAEQLEQVEVMRRRLIGDVAHELRTPLTAIKGSMEGLIDGVLPATPETFEQIYQEAERLNRLVDDLQELSRVEAGAYELSLRLVSAASVVGTVVKRLHLQFEEKGVELSTHLPAEEVQFWADEDRIVQVLTNLVGNALQYTPAGGKVTISVGRQADGVRFSVRDTGIGISAEHLPHIFDRFYRVDKSRSRARGGSGVGLTIAKYLVEAHGGRIWAESEGEGKGSTFIFTLPLTRRDSRSG